MAEQSEDPVARALAAAQAIVDHLGDLELEGQPYTAVHVIYAARDEFNDAMTEFQRG